MHTLSLDYHASQITSHEWEVLVKNAAIYHEQVRAALLAAEPSVYDFMKLPLSEILRTAIEAAVGQKRKLNPDLLVIVGIGGSNLGTIAIHEALQEAEKEGKNSSVPVVYADTVDPDAMQLVLEQIAASSRPLVVIISKSGTTPETVGNAAVITHLLQAKLGTETSKHIVVISDRGSALWHVGTHEGYTCLSIPDSVGGRYSVFSAVGLFPLSFLGISPAALHEGAQRIITECMQENPATNRALKRACWLVYHHTRGKMVHELFVGAKGLTQIGAWYRQLMAESLGKTERVGIVPTTSVGTIDLHSVAQLSLAGPTVSFTTFLQVKKFVNEVMVPAHTPFDTLAPFIINTSFSQVMNASLQGTQAAYQQQGRPFVTLTMAEINPKNIGELLQLYLCEIMYAGLLLGINPFDQPQVELYKQNMRKILAHE